RSRSNDGRRSERVHTTALSIPAICGVQGLRQYERCIKLELQMSFRTAVGAVLLLAMIAAGASIASAQLHPPEVKGLRGATFPSEYPPPDIRSYGEGPA